MTTGLKYSRHFDKSTPPKAGGANFETVRHLTYQPKQVLGLGHDKQLNYHRINRHTNKYVPGKSILTKLYV